MFTALSLPDLDALDHAALKALLLSQQQKHLEQQNFYRKRPVLAACTYLDGAVMMCRWQTLM